MFVESHYGSVAFKLNERWCYCEALSRQRESNKKTLYWNKDLLKREDQMKVSWPSITHTWLAFSFLLPGYFNLIKLTYIIYIYFLLFFFFFWMRIMRPPPQLLICFCQRCVFSHFEPIWSRSHSPQSNVHYNNIIITHYWGRMSETVRLHATHVKHTHNHSYPV